jgi:hypothetical protein
MSDAHGALRFTRRYAAAPEAVWTALTDPESLARWLAPPPGVDPQPRALEDGRLLELDWTPSGEPESLVRIEVNGDEGGTLLVLDHSRLDMRICMRYFAFWEPRLSRLGVRFGGDRP